MPLHNRATLSIAGLYNWNEHIFDDLVLPVSIDKNEIIDDILYTCADLEIVYPDWNVMKHAIKVWSEEALYRWNKIETLAEAEYNPLENYDMMETESIHDNREKKKNDVSTGKVKTENVASNNNSNTNTVTNAVTGYNTTSPVTNTQDTTTGNETGNGISNGQATTNDIRTGNETETGNVVRNNRRHGNLGVMTPADMIKKELEVYPQLNLYAIIPTEFKMRFCLLVY